jgi:hypothetical protein
MTRTWSDVAADIDLEISRATGREQLLELSRRRNEVTPFYRLPTETFECILLAVQAGKEQSSDENRDTRSNPHILYPADFHYDGSSWSDTNLTWVRAMHICRRLREVALASTLLWSNVSMNHKNTTWVDLCIQRAGSHSLRLDAYLRRSGNNIAPARFSHLFSSSHSIRLRLCFEEVDVEEDLLDDINFLAADTAIKETLQLCRTSSRLSFLEIFNELGTMRLHKTFLGTDSSNLTHLLLEEIELDNIDVPNMPLLRRLILQGVNNDLDCRQVRSFLCQTPNLQELYILELWDSDETRLEGDFTSPIPDISHYSPVSLPHLATLHTAGELIQISQILLLCLPPGNEAYGIKLYVDIRDIGYDIIDVDNPESMNHFLNLSRPIHTRIAQHLSVLSPSERVQECTLQLSEMSGNIKDIGLKYGELNHEHQPFHAITYLPYAIGDDIANLIYYAKRVTVVLSPGGSLDTFIADVCAACQMRFLVIKNLALHTRRGGTVGDNARQEHLEQLLSQRMQRYDAPVQHLTLTYYTYSSPQGRDVFMLAAFPPLAVREALEKKWKGAGWVNEVAWLEEGAVEGMLV